MGLFRNKEKIPDGIRVTFYEGELREFECNYPCQLLLMEDCLRITKIKPYVEVKLDRSRISSIDIFLEREYMLKYKGVATETTKMKSVPKYYYVINYVDKEGNNKHLDFWGTECSKIRKLRESLMANKQAGSYEI